MSDAGTFGYGQMVPTDTASQLAIISFVVRQMMARLDTMKLVQVKAVHGGGGAIAAAGTVDVLPLVNQVDGNFNATPHGIVYGLPWWRLQGGNSGLICDPVAGDIGYVMCADRDSSAVVRTKQQSNPGTRRKHNIADGIYVGGLLNGPPTQYIVFTSQGIKIVDINGNVLEMTSAGFELMGNVKVTGNIEATGAVIAGFGTPDQVGLQTHFTASFGTPPTPGT